MKTMKQGTKTMKQGLWLKFTAVVANVRAKWRDRRDRRDRRARQVSAMENLAAWLKTDEGKAARASVPYMTEDE